jgi:hypothetical protein
VFIWPRLDDDMTENSRNSMTVRVLPATAAAALCGLALGACGSGSGGTAQQSQRDRAQDGALKFARCMRGEGLDFPDPQVSANGAIRIGPGTGKPGFRPDAPKARAAEQKCRKYLQFGGGQRPSAAQQAKFRDAFVKFAQCMRRNGVDVPDPQPGGGGFIFRRRGGAGGPTGPNPDSPKFQAAQAKCRPLLGDIGGGFSTSRAPR